jgi:hypothetical protein
MPVRGMDYAGKGYSASTVACAGTRARKAGSCRPLAGAQACEGDGAQLDAVDGKGCVEYSEYPAGDMAYGVCFVCRRTALHLAASKGHATVVKILLAKVCPMCACMLGLAAMPRRFCGRMQARIALKKPRRPMKARQRRFGCHSAMRGRSTALCAVPTARHAALVKACGPLMPLLGTLHVLPVQAARVLHGYSTGTLPVLLVQAAAIPLGNAKLLDCGDTAYGYGTARPRCGYLEYPWTTD